MDHNRWFAYQKVNDFVTVYDITNEGFGLRTQKNNYCISREKYPKFQNASDEEIRDVAVTVDVNDTPEGETCLRIKFKGETGAVGYDYDKNVMEVEFTDGAIYQYKCPDSEVEDLFDADSRGQWFYYNIRTSYPFRKIRDRFPWTPSRLS